MNDRTHDAARKLHNQKYADSSKKRLMTNITKKFQTTMIGALAAFEAEFGHLWGLNSDKPPTEEENEWLEVWKDVRSAILDNGNGNLRACLDEISQYSITWDRYKIDFIVKKDDKEL